MLKVAKLSEEPEQSLLPPSGQVNADDIADKSLYKASVQPVIQSKAKNNLKTKKKKIPPSSKPKSPHKVRVILPKKQVTEIRHAEVTVTTVDATKSIEAFELAEEQENQSSIAEVVKFMQVLDQNVEEEKDAEFVAIEEVVEEQSLEIPTVEQLMDEAGKLNKTVQETPKSPYDTKLEIKIVKSFFTHHISKLKDQTMHDSEETVDIHEGSNSDLHSMPNDDLKSVSRFHTANSDDTHENKVSKSDHIFQDDNAFPKCLSLPDHTDHICEEVSSLHLRLGDMESCSESYSPSIKSSVLKSMAEELPHVEAQVQKNLQDQFPNLLLKPMYKEFNAFNKLDSQRFVLLQKELTKSLHKNMKKSIRLKVRKGMKEVQDKLSCCTSTVATNSQYVQDLRVMFKDMVSLLEAVEVFKKANAEGEKWEKNNFAEEKDAQHPDQTKREQISGAKIANIVLHNLEEKKDGNVLMEDDSDEDDLDKQPLLKRFKIMTPIPNPISLNTFFSPTPPTEPTPPRDPAKGKEVAIVKKQVNKLVTYQEEGGSIPKMSKLKSFITLEGTLSLEELNNQIKERKRISDLKAQKNKFEQELRKMFNQATLKAQAKKWSEHEAKKDKILEEYSHRISFRADPLPITKIIYSVNSNKEATMKIIRGDNPLNLIVHPNFRLKSLGFSEWMEVHALASKKTGKSNDMLLQSLRAKFQWVMVQAKKLGLPPPPALATFGITAEEKKRKMTQFLKEAFITEDIRVDRMDRNLIPPPGVVPIEGLVIKEPESRIFYMNRNTDIVFQRESEFHLTPTVQLIRIQNQIKVDSEIADEMFRKMIYVIEAMSDCIKAKETVMKEPLSDGLRGNERTSEWWTH
ncbi:hypothetical protein Tco_1333008, partial [Tanacetum coccineum]